MSATATPNLLHASILDFDHLLGLSCLWVMAGRRPLDRATFKLETTVEVAPPEIETFQQLPWYSVLEHVWTLGGRHMNLTSVGALIGVLHHDQLKRTRTTVAW